VLRDKKQREEREINQSKKDKRERSRRVSGRQSFYWGLQDTSNNEKRKRTKNSNPARVLRANSVEREKNRKGKKRREGQIIQGASNL